MTNMDKMDESKIIAVIRTDDIKTARKFSHGCIEGGIKLLEVITINDNSYDLIKELSSNDNILVGAGTVLNLQMAEKAIHAGAKFIVSPHTDKEIIGFTKSCGLVSVAGAFTSSEIVNAHNLGADYVKIFPASSVGPDYIRAIKEALPFVKILVTGGNYDNALDYISSGASLLGVVSALNGNAESLEKENIIKNSNKFIDLLN